MSTKLGIRAAAKRTRPKLIMRPVRSDMAGALARALAHKNAGHHAEASQWATRLVRLLREHDVLGDDL